MENTLEEKQSYLKKEIIDENYDGDLFSEFLLSKNEDGLNLDLWSFDELKAFVLEFKTAIKEYEAKLAEQEKTYFQEDPYQGNSDNHITNKDESSTQINNLQATNLLEERSQSSASYKSSDNETSTDNTITNTTTGNTTTHNANINTSINLEVNYSETIPAKLLRKSEFEKHENITITIPSFDKHPGSLFKKEYISYQIKTDPFNFNVARRYSDFSLLYSALQTIFIGSVIPPIPKKNFGDRFIDSMVNKRKRNLEKFLQAVLTIPIIRNSPVLYDFLSISKESDFKKSFSQYNNLQRPQFSQIPSCNGFLELKISKESDNYIEQIRANNEQNEVFLNKLSLLSKGLYTDIIQVSNRMEEISETFNQMYKYCSNCQDIDSITETYRLMSDLMKKWSECEKRQASMVETDLREHFKYVKNELGQMKDLFAKVDDSAKNFYKQYKSLTLKKDELWKKKEIKNWGLSDEDMKNSNELLHNKDLAISKMLPKKTAELIHAKKEYGYYSTSILSEFERMRKINGKRHQDDCLNMFNSHRAILSDLQFIWADVSTSILSN